MSTGAQPDDPRVTTVLEHMRLENAHDFPACIAKFSRPRYEVVATDETHDGAAPVEGLLDENRRAFPDFRFDARRVTPGAGHVLVEGSFIGTHDGAWRGLPATGRKVDFPMAVIFEFEGEELVCERVYFDLGTVFQQLGVARDPMSLGGRLTILVTHPVTIGRALVRSLFRRLRPHRRGR